jgi:hypothetical protein
VDEFGRGAGQPAEPRAERRIELVMRRQPGVADTVYSLSARGGRHARQYRCKQDVRGDQGQHWFEAHHIIPRSQLTGAIASIGQGTPNANKLQLMVRRGLMEENYNLNHKKNMIILPMDGLVAKALELPKHLATPDHRDHPRYSKHVEGKIKKFFNPVMETKSRHEKKVEYGPVREKLESLSTLLRGKIKRLGKDLWSTQGDVSLNDINPASPKTKSSLRSLNV